MKFHEFQFQLQNRPAPKTRHYLQGNVVRLYLTEWESDYNISELPKEMKDLLDRGLDVYLYDQFGDVRVFGAIGNGKKTPWRRKIGSSGFRYYKTVEEALR